MKNVLFLYPPQNFKIKTDPREGLIPPLGLLYLKSMLKDVNVKILDLTISSNPKRDFLKTYKSEKWDAIGITVLTYSLNSVKQIMDFIKKDGNTYTIAGGPHATLIPKDCLSMGFDAALVGEGELVISDVINNQPKGVIRGKPVEDLDKLPFVDRSVLENNKYGVFGPLNIPGLSTSITTSRGCPFNCRFCGRTIKGSIRKRSVRNVIDELKLLAKQGFKNILILDDNFIVDKKWILTFCKVLKRENLELNFFCDARVDTFSKEIAKALKEINMQFMMFGVETIHPEILKFYNKTKAPMMWPKFTKNALEYCNELGIWTTTSLIIGAPMETEEIFWKTYNFVRKHGADVINVNPLTYIVGSEIWNDAVRNNIIKKNEYIISVKDRKLSPIYPERITEICDKAFRGVLQNSTRVFIKSLKHLDRLKFKVLVDVFFDGMKTCLTSTLKGNDWKMRYDVFKEDRTKKGRGLIPTHN